MPDVAGWPLIAGNRHPLQKPMTPSYADGL